MPEALLPVSLPYETIWTDEPSIDARILVAHIPVSIEMTAFSIKIVVEGEMDEGIAKRLAREIKENVEADTGLPCILESIIESSRRV